MEQNWFAHLLNVSFGHSVSGLLSVVGYHAADPAAPFTNGFSMEVFVALLLLVFGMWLGRSLSVDRPGGWQQTIELFWTGLGDHSEDIIGHGGSRFLPFLFTLTILILTSNLIGLIPGMESPTASITTTVGLAICIWVTYHFVGIRKHGIGYVKSFIGPLWWLAIVMVPVELISHFARILSLSVRLYANMFAGDMITMVFIALLPISGLIFMGLHVFVALLQTYIFVVLSMVYLQGALAEEH